MSRSVERRPAGAGRQLKELAGEARRRLRTLRQAQPPTPWPAGHFYSPIPDLDEVRRRDHRIFAVPEELPGIDLRASEQLALVAELAAHVTDMGFDAEPVVGLRYHLENRFFAWADGIVLHAMLRHLRPSRVIEVGSGFSSALMLDTRDRWLPDLHCTFIEPNPARLFGLLGGGDRAGVEIIEGAVQDVPVDALTDLGAGDILFIDGSHVSKVGSDVNHLYFEVLPRLRDGVVVHIHDIFFPFEYPADWVYRGRAWNECYLLRALLMDNPGFEILLFNSYLRTAHRDVVAAALPGWDRSGGGSIWLRRVAPGG